MAPPISYEIVTETWESLAETPIEEAKALVDLMELEQPTVMHYLLDLENSPFDQVEKEIIFYIGTVIWQVMKQSEQPANTVRTEDIKQVEEANYKFLDMLANDTQADFLSATQDLVDHYDEPEVLRFILEALMDDEGYEEYSDEHEFDDEDNPETNGFDSRAQLEGLGETLDIVPGENGEYDQFEEDEEEIESVRPELRGIAFVHLKTVLDAFISSRN
jgi:hypothetical protein